MNYLVWFVSILVISWFLTGAIRRYALARNIMDIPNNRSSHSIPTPRGGGGAIVVVFIASLLISAYISENLLTIYIALLGAGTLVGIVGFIDDHQHIPARWRLLIHFVAAGWAIYWLSDIQGIILFGTIQLEGWFLSTMLIIYIVWLLNLFNFMDGIDGIVGIETLTVCLGAVMLCLQASSVNCNFYLPLLMMASVSGFLIWNFPRAKIFMGDVGSSFIGLILGIMSVASVMNNPVMFWCWLILLGAFIVDATVTLVRRILRGQKFYIAHRSHAYQYASHKYNSHIKVSLFFGLINIIWLFPVAVSVLLGWFDGALGVFIAYCPLVYLAIRFKAGAAELQKKRT